MLVVLKDAEKRLNTLRDVIDNFDTLRSTSSLRWQSRALLQRDVDVVKSLTVLALEMVGMIRVVQGQVQHAEPPVEFSRWANARTSQTRKRLIYATDQTAGICYT